ncbi:hypothetical protein HPB49_002782 [Dermacentor silvarum]|uniref:Uncharacterized protein n=2 Tax=Dermacentor silvarum TaxID=543639 RepID=A0ACB8CJ99_DERSI|nr:hypothetical protein HPB49_002782 [Dermacentor silvarum]
MAVTESSKGINVVFQNKHRGHDFKLCHIFLSDTERSAIAGKLKAGTAMGAIMDSIRDSVDGSWKRLHLLTRQDLYNIQRAFKINCNERLHNDDQTSVLLWVEKMKSQDDNPVLFFKQQGMADSATVLQRRNTDLLKDDDFMLVLMTKPQQELLQKLGSYDFQLVTLLCVDEYGTGFPVAFCITSRVDKQGMEVFFKALRQRTGQITTKAFMSDDAPAFYNAWKAVMGSADRQLLCAWHVDKNWRENIRKHVKDQELQALVYKHVNRLLTLPKKLLEDHSFAEKCVNSENAFLGGLLEQLNDRILLGYCLVPRKVNMFAMIEQLGKPTFFPTLSMSRLNNEGLLEIIERVKGLVKALRTMMDAPTEEMFKGTMEDFSDFCDDHGRDTNGLIRFKTYFMQNYFHRAEVWAACYRKEYNINTNMRLEALHRVIKYCYLGGKNNKRIDRLIAMLLKLVRDKVFDRLIKLSKNAATTFYEETQSRHKAGEEICNSEIEAAGTVRRLRKKRKRTMYIRELFDKRPQLGDYHQLVQELRQVDPEYHFKYFRMTKAKFDHLLSLVYERILHAPNHRRPIRPAERLAVTLRYT